MGVFVSNPLVSASLNERKPSLMTHMSELVIKRGRANESHPERLRFKLAYDRKSASEQMSEVEEAIRHAGKEKCMRGFRTNHGSTGTGLHR
jgi:hypothetical protein